MVSVAVAIRFNYIRRSNRVRFPISANYLETIFRIFRTFNIEKDFKTLLFRIKM